MKDKIAFIGAGNMGGPLLERACQVAEAENVVLYRPDQAAGRAQAQRIGCKLAKSGEEAVRDAKLVALCVKPQAIPKVLRGLVPALRENVASGGKPLVASIAAGVTLAQLRSILKEGELDLPVVRLMPNTPVAIAQGVVLMAPDDETSEEHIWELGRLLADCGSIHRVTEAELDLGTAITGCGPAFVYQFIEALADGGVQIGLSRAWAQTWAAQMVAGAAGMVLETGLHPGKLKDAVCSPAGTTIAGVSVLEQHAFRGAVSQAVVAAYERSREIAKLGQPESDDE